MRTLSDMMINNNWLKNKIMDNSFKLVVKIQN